MSKTDRPPVPLGTVTVPVGRAYWVKFSNNPEKTAESTLLLAQMGGSAKLDDGAEVEFTGAGQTLRVHFKYPDDDSDARHHQDYEVDIGDLIESLHKLNKVRREEKFADAPVQVLP